MQKLLAKAGLAAGLILITGCANQNHWTSNVGADTPVTTGGVKVANESPGSQGPVADNSRLAINHRDVAAREAAARERLARSAETRRRTQVTDNTYSRSSAPVAAQAPAAKPKTYLRRHQAKAAKTPARVPMRNAGMRSDELRPFNREVALNELHHINQKEIAMAKMAHANSASRVIKSEAARIERDHRQLEAKVEEVAKNHEITLAKFTPATYEGVKMDKLEKMIGRNFDIAFAENVADGHKLTAAQLRVLRARVSDRDVLALIDETMPKVRRHEKSSENVLGSIKAGNDYSARR